jgi:hypothetical protein
MTKQIYLLYLIGLFVLVSCEEYYHPDLDTVNNLLVVESRITNEPAQNFVRISKTVNFYAASTTNPVSGATCTILTEDGQRIEGLENSDGYFLFPFVPQAGSNYKLQISYGAETYESDFEKMPPLPTLDSIYAEITTKTSYSTDAYGKPYTNEDVGFDLRINAPIYSENTYYRFSWRGILQWYIELESEMGPPPPPIYGWKSFYDTDVFNLAGPKDYTSSDKVTNHSVLYRSLDYYASYLDSAAMIPAGWIFIVHQYGITPNSYSFYKKINDQLEASGQLFDPVYTQIYGNMHCTSNPDQIILGNFDLCSYKQHRYFVHGYKSSISLIQHVINSYPNIPATGMTTDGTLPGFWESTY